MSKTRSSVYYDSFSKLVFVNVQCVFEYRDDPQPVRLQALYTNKQRTICAVMRSVVSVKGMNNWIMQCMILLECLSMYNVHVQIKNAMGSGVCVSKTRSSA